MVSGLVALAPGHRFAAAQRLRAHPAPSRGAHVVQRYSAPPAGARRARRLGVTITAYPSRRRSCVPWHLVVAMPAASLPRAVEAGNTAVVPFADARYQELIAAQPQVRSFLESFRTAFGHQLRPSIVIRDREAERMQADDLAALRNSIALAAVIKARTDRCMHRFGGEGPVYADLFELYPVNLAMDGETLMVQTAAEFGMDDDLARFQGQPHPGYIYPQTVRPEFDDTLLESLMRFWQRQPVDQDEERFRRLVFRSLETAYHALASPFLNLGSEYDHTLALALWVSAFEILLGREGNVSADAVERQISRVGWQHAALRRDLVESARGPRPGRPVLRPVQVYSRLYKVRNEALHGGTITKHLVLHRLGEQEEDAPALSLLRADEWNHLAVAVPALYRGVLLDLLAQTGFHRHADAPADIEEYGDYLEMYDDQRYFEKPLLFRCRHRR